MVQLLEDENTAEVHLQRAGYLATKVSVLTDVLWLKVTKDDSPVMQVPKGGCQLSGILRLHDHLRGVFHVLVDRRPPPLLHALLKCITKEIRDSKEAIVTTCL